jgi:peroxiredoxin Q/BCP
VEGCGYRDLYADFQALGIEIVGVSKDSPAKNDAWAEDEGFQFELWTDDQNDLALYYGAAATETQSYFARLTKILDSDGTLVLEYQVSSVGTHPAQVLEDCQVLFGD